MNELSTKFGRRILRQVIVYRRICICNWKNVLGTHHASAHGGSSDLIVKMLDYIILK